MKINNINEIKAREYEGYIWYSDKTKPTTSIPDFGTLSQNQDPFIIEGMLYCKNDNISISIKHTGTYQIYEFDLKELKKNNKIESVSFLSHKLEGVEKLNFVQIWKEEEDPLCKPFPVLTQKAIVFTGFTPLNK